MRLNGRPVKLRQLLAELRAAGIDLPALGLEQDGEVLLTYDQNGVIIDLPPAAAAIVEAHVPEPDPPNPIENVRTDALDTLITQAQTAATDAQAASTLAEAKAALVAVAQLVRTLAQAFRAVVVLLRRRERLDEGD